MRNLRVLTRGEGRPAYRRFWGLGAALAVSAAACVAATPASAAALRVYTWGNNGAGQLGNGTTVNSNTPGPLSLTKVKSVAAGANFSLVLLANGTVDAFGEGASGQLGDGSNAQSDVPVKVSGLTGVAAIAASNYGGLALLKTGTVWAWGYNGYGQLGNGEHEKNSNVPVQVAGLAEVKAISAQGSHDLALLKSGQVFAWGRNGNGEAGQGTTEPYVIDNAVAVPGVSAKAIAAGLYHSLAVLKNGTVMAWGDNNSGQLGNGTTEETSTPHLIPGLSKVASVSAGDDFSVALLADRTVKAWGDNGFGELGNGDNSGKPSYTPVAVVGLAEVASLSAGEYFAVALLKSGLVKSWGFGGGGALGNGGNAGSSSPVSVSGLTGAKSVAAGGQFGLAAAP